MCFIRGLQYIWLAAIAVSLVMFVITSERDLALVGVIAVIAILLIRHYWRRQAIRWMKGEYDNE